MSEADKIIESLKNSGRKVEEFYTGNKGSDKNVGSIEEDIRILQEKDCMWHYPETRIEEAIENIIADYTRQKEINEEHQKINGELRERIQELENKLQDINTYILINGIDEPLRTATQIQVKNQHEYIIQQKINKLEEERDHWHGCFIVAMENGITKEKVKNVLKNNRNEIFSATYLSREQFRPYEMQIERINKIEQELLGKEN